MSALWFRSAFRLHSVCLERICCGCLGSCIADLFFQIFSGTDDFVLTFRQHGLERNSKLEQNAKLDQDNKLEQDIKLEQNSMLAQDDMKVESVEDVVTTASNSEADAKNAQTRAQHSLGSQSVIISDEKTRLFGYAVEAEVPQECAPESMTSEPVNYSPIETIGVPQRSISAFEVATSNARSHGISDLVQDSFVPQAAPPPPPITVICLKCRYLLAT
jgi:hypothetical protein